MYICGYLWTHHKQNTECVTSKQKNEKIKKFKKVRDNNQKQEIKDMTKYIK